MSTSRRSIRRILAFAAFATGLIAAAGAHAVEVTFQVRMGYQMELGVFDPSEDFVDLAGTFNGWGSAPLTPLTDIDGDSIYAVTLDGFAPSQEIEFKFRINGLWDGTEEFPGIGNNRVYTVQESGNAILVWYNDLQSGGGVGEVYWWNDRIFYEIFVRSFYDSDGDGIGDFLGLTQKLDYLNDGNPTTSNDLGITGIWLMPIHDSPSYHGYDVIDYRSINPDYGTLADFQAFLAAAHARGIKVIIDLVMNHCSSQHPWFLAAASNNPAYRDYFRWSASDPGQTGPWGQDVWHWNPSGWYYGLFTGAMPDLNYATAAVKDSMFAVADYWLETVGVDGFRLDAVLYILEDGDQLQNTPATLQFWADYNAHVKSVDAEALSVGEAWTATSTVLQYVTQDRLDLCFEFDLSYAMLDGVAWGDAGWLRTKTSQVYTSYPYLQYVTFLTNHDQDRVMNVLGFDVGKTKAAAGMYLTLPGVPFLYYGEEIGMTGSGPDQNSRTPMQWTSADNAGFTTGAPWEPVNGDYPQRNVLVEEQDSGSLLNWYKRLIAVRNEAPALRRGTYSVLAASASPVLAYIREYGGQKLLCMVNTASNSIGGITLAGSASSLGAGEHRLANLLVEGDTLDITVSSAHEISGIGLAPFDVAVYEFVDDTVTGRDDGPMPGFMFKLDQNRPNPFNPSTIINFSLSETSRVTLEVFAVTGAKVATLVDREMTSGEHSVPFDAAGLSSGVYLYRLTAGGRAETKKMVLLK